MLSDDSIETAAWRAQFLASWLLRLTGAFICLSAIAIFLPMDTMAEIHQLLGMGAFPREPIVEYLARSLSAMYFVHGVVVLSLSFQIKRCWHLVGVLGCLNLFLGGVLLWVDFRVAMPWYWTWTEGPSVALAGLLLAFLWFRGSRAST